MSARNPGNTRLNAARAGIVVVCAVLVVVSAGCARRSSSRASTEKVNVCAAVATLNKLEPPKPEDQRDMQRYARDFEQTLKNVNWKFKYRDTKGELQEPPKDIRLQFDNMLQVVQRFRTQVDSAGSDSAGGDGAAALALGTAASDLANSETFLGADRALQAFLVEKCRG